MLRIDNLIDDAKCYESVRELRWPQGVRCPWCQSDQIKKRGLHQRQRERPGYRCKSCDRIRMLPDVKQRTIKPIVVGKIAPGTIIMTDEYDISARLTAWGYGHQTVCHSKGEFARDEDGDGFCEIHVNTIEG